MASERRHGRNRRRFVQGVHLDADELQRPGVAGGVRHAVDIIAVVGGGVAAVGFFLII